MARPAAEKVGRGVCPDAGCGNPVMYRRSAGGMLSHRCDLCDSIGYAPPGSDAYRRRMATIDAPASEPAPKPDPKPAPDPAPTPKRKASVFGLGDL